jgi:protein-tyrosine phosphatase
MSAIEQAAGSIPPPRSPAGPYRICLVCLGNICRSPTAEVVLREELDKAGLSGKAVDGSGHQARQIERSWLADYDLVLAMDGRNLASLRRMAGDDPGQAGRIQLMRSFDPESEHGAEVPDPYDGSPEEFAEVFDLVAAAARGVARKLAAAL